jgi:NADH-quinone oxidoreductase subunit N
MTDTTTIYLLLPEIVLIAAATLIYLAGAFCPRHFWPHAAAVGAIVLAGVLLGWQDCHVHVGMVSLAPPVKTSGPLAIDLLGQICLWAILLFGLLLVMLSSDSPTVRPAAEYVGSLLLIVAGLMIVAVGYDLVLLFVGLELISIPTYIVLYLGRRDPFGQEATMKYFFLSILSSALLLYGFSFLYGAAGATRLDELRKALEHAPAMIEGGVSLPGFTLAPVAVLLVFAGLGFRMTCVPLHFYAPDVYQGTSHANAGLLSTLPKIAGLLVLVRIVYASMPGLETLSWKVALVMAVATMTLGNLVALWQTDIRRLLAYSSIAHGGYILIGIAAGLAHSESYSGGEMIGFQLQGVGAAFFYLAVYCLATIGAFAALKYLGGREQQVDGLDELAGLGRSRPLPALALAVSMFSLAGVPPLAGFWGKLTLFTSALGVDSSPLRPWFVGLAIVGAINAAIAMAYYLRVVGVMYFRMSATGAPSPVKAEGGAGAWWAMVACTVMVLGVGVYPGPIIRATDRAAHAIRQAAEPVETGKIESALLGAMPTALRGHGLADRVGSIILPASQLR